MEISGTTITCSWNCDHVEDSLEGSKMKYILEIEVHTLLAHAYVTFSIFCSNPGLQNKSFKEIEEFYEESYLKYEKDVAENGMRACPPDWAKCIRQFVERTNELSFEVVYDYKVKRDNLNLFGRSIYSGSSNIYYI